MGSVVAHPISLWFGGLLLSLQKIIVAMKKLFPIFVLLLAIGCQKTELEEQEGRNAKEEQKDSASVTPTFEAEDWGDSIPIGF